MANMTDQLSAYAKGLGLQPTFKYKAGGFTKLLPRLQSTGGLVVDGQLKRQLEEQGYEFLDERDNKSVTTPEALFDALAAYFEEPELRVQEAAFQRAVDLTFEAFGGRKYGEVLPVLSLDDNLRQHMQEARSSGAPNFTSKGEAFTSDLALAAQIASGDVKPPPCVPYRRGQHGEKGPKTRLVWGYPQAMTMLEARFARPLIDRFIRYGGPMSFGSSLVGLGADLLMIEEATVRISMDFSRFDASLQPRLLGVARRVIASHFGGFTEEERASWNKVWKYFTETPIAMPDGWVYTTTKGVPSGSYFTQVVDSICNYLALQYAFIKTTEHSVPMWRVRVLGDDAVLGLDRWVSITKVCEALKDLGLVANPEKVGVSRQGEFFNFLGHSWYGGRRTRPTEELVKRLVYPERHWSLTNVDRLTRMVDLCTSVTGGFPFLCQLTGVVKPRSWMCIRISPESTSSWTQLQRQEHPAYDRLLRGGNAFERALFGSL